MRTRRFPLVSRALCLALALLTFMGSIQKASAPIPLPVALGLKCVAAPVIVGTAAIIWNCQASYYLVCYQMDGEEPYWEASQASAATLRKTNGKRWQGPWRTREEPDLRAWVNNASPDNPMFGMGPLGTIPAPTYTNYNVLRITMSQSTDGKKGSQWAYSGTMFVEPGEENWGIAVMSKSGTNGMSAAEIRQVLDTDMQVVQESRNALYDLAFDEPKDK